MTHSIMLLCIHVDYKQQLVMDAIGMMVPRNSRSVDWLFMVLYHNKFIVKNVCDYKWTDTEL